LDGIEEDWNKRVDTDVEVLVEGMHDLVSIASVSIPRAMVKHSLTRHFA
jgi:mediator of RNA polymerase II transcription subunit 22